MHGGEDELHTGAGEAGRVGGAGELPHRVTGGGRRQHDLADQSGGLDPAGVVAEGEPLPVAFGSFGDVGGDHPPLLTEPVQQELCGGGVAADLLDGDHVEAGDDLGDAGDRVPVPFGGVLGSGFPLRGEVGERAQVPGRDQKVALGT